MITITYNITDLIFTILDRQTYLTMSEFRNIVQDIKHDYFKNNAEIIFKFTEDTYFIDIVKLYPKHFQVKFNSGNAMLIKKQKINFSYNKVYFKYIGLRKNKLKQICQNMTI